MRSTIFLTLFTHLSLLIAELEHVRPCSAYQHLNPTTFRCCGKRHVSEGVTPIVSASLRDRNPRSSTRKLLRKPWEAALSSNIINANDRRRSGIQGTGDRGMGMRAAAMDTTTVSGLMSHTSPPGSRSVNWPLWYVLPIAPYQKRKTIMEEIVPGKLIYEGRLARATDAEEHGLRYSYLPTALIWGTDYEVWTFDQLQGILYVIVPVRMTVIKLQNTPGGGLFVYAPVAPTGECMTMIRRLEAEHGPVRHIVLGTLGLEHKVFAGPFAQRFKEAQVWYTPGQYSFPIGLPLSWLGFGGRPTKEIPASASDAPWSADLDHAVLGPFFSKDGSGGYGETAFFHKDTKTLLVTDMVVKIEDQVPEIVAQDPRPLLFHARDNALERVEDTPEVRLKGWRRIVQFALTFQPSSLVVVDLKRALFEDAPRSKMKELGWGGLFPFEWKNPVQDAKSFDAFKGGLLVAPILQVLLLNRNPEAVLDWADRVARWPFRRVIPCHLANNVAAMPQDFRNAFRFLEKGGAHVMGGGLLSSIFGNGRVARNGRGAQPLDEDLQFLRDAEKTLVELGTLFPAAQAVDRSRR